MARSVSPVEAERRARLVARWRESGESASEFARRHGVSAWMLYAWAKRSGSRQLGPKRRGGPGSAGRMDLLPVRLVGERVSASAPSGPVVEVQLRGGEVIRVVGDVPVERVRAVVTAVLEAC